MSFFREDKKKTSKKNSLHPCALGERSLSIGMVIRAFREGISTVKCAYPNHISAGALVMAFFKCHCGERERESWVLFSVCVCVSCGWPLAGVNCHVSVIHVVVLVVPAIDALLLPSSFLRLGLARSLAPLQQQLSSSLWLWLCSSLRDVNASISGQSDEYESPLLLLLAAERASQRGDWASERER